jgi:hypothetical protein
MSPIVTKPEFRAPSDILEKEVARLNVPLPKAPLAVVATPLLGTWVNCNHQAPGLVRLMISAIGNGVMVHGFGACTPTPCDWGAVPGHIYADNVTATPAVAFSAIYTFAFKQTTIVGHLLKGALMVETFDHFTDNSGRADYYSLNILAQ